MKRLVYLVLIVSVLSASSCATAAPGAPQEVQESTLVKDPTLKGWDYLARKLMDAGVPEARVRRIFTSPQMPVFTTITFRVKPQEGYDLYSKFRTPEKIQEGRAYLAKYKTAIEHAQNLYQVDKRVIAAIHLVETHFGENTGKESVLYRLARVSTVNEPENLRKNFERLQVDTPDLEFDAVRDRAEFLERTFLPEIVALIEIADKNRVDIFGIKGSIAGAFGIPQFLPSSFLKYGVDCNGDGIVSLFTLQDAMCSTAHYLQGYGWKDSLDHAGKAKVVWHYNHSEPYVETVLWLAENF